METILTGYPSLPSKLWGRMQGWYSAAVDHAPPPARITLKRITAERKELYCAVPPIIFWGGRDTQSELFPCPLLLASPAVVCIILAPP